jgi:hypothetical protein
MTYGARSGGASSAGRLSRHLRKEPPHEEARLVHVHVDRRLHRDPDGGLEWVPIDDELMRLANEYFSGWPLPFFREAMASA